MPESTKPTGVEFTLSMDVSGLVTIAPVAGPPGAQQVTMPVADALAMLSPMRWNAQRQQSIVAWLEQGMTLSGMYMPPEDAASLFTPPVLPPEFDEAPEFEGHFDPAEVDEDALLREMAHEAYPGLSEEEIERALAQSRTSPPAEAGMLHEDEPEEPFSGLTQAQLERRERMASRAASLHEQAAERFQREHQILGRIEPGQPILFGHHSARRHVRDLERAQQAAHAGSKLHQEAQRAEWSAAHGAGRAILSDDLEAVKALKAKVIKLEAERDRSKQINAMWKKGGVEELRRQGVDEESIFSILRSMALQPYYDKPYPTYVFTNLGARIRDAKKRIEDLQAAAAMQPAEAVAGDGWEISEDQADMRIRLRFPERLSREQVAVIKHNGFHWSRGNGAWQRLLNQAGRYAARRVIQELFGIALPPP